MKLSIIMPVAGYNLEWVQQAIGSALPFTDEFIAVADEGAQFCPHLNHPRIKLITIEKFPGAGRAINVGVAASTGDYFSVLCSDDYYQSDVAFRIRNLIEADGKYDIYGASVDHFGLINSTWPVDGNVQAIHNLNNIASPAFVRKSLWFQVGGYEDKIYADWHFWWKCITNGAIYHFTNEIFYHYRAWYGTLSYRICRYSSNLKRDW